MSFLHTLLTIAEFAVGGFIIWGFFNEDKFVRFERRLAARIARRFGRKCAARPCSYNIIVGNGNCNKIA